MKTLIKTWRDLEKAARWDIDFHLPAERILQFDPSILKRVDEVADIASGKRDPGSSPDDTFQYIDIAAVDVSAGIITNPQDVEGSDAPSRARKVVRAFDVIVSTCRPTRGAIAVVPVSLHNEIASTAFSVVRPRVGLNPFYLHFALRMPSTLEQFRKWSTGSSYPAILDSDVKKTLIPVPSPEKQDEIAALLIEGLNRRDEEIRMADNAWNRTTAAITQSLSIARESPSVQQTPHQNLFDLFDLASINQIIKGLPDLTVDRGRGRDTSEDAEDLFSSALL